MAGIEDVATPDDGVELPADTWTVAELNAEIGAVLAEQADRFPAYVIGEVADVDEYPFGTFFDLADPDDEAVIGCLAWSQVLDSFDHELTAGTTTIVRAEVDFYAERGDCQLMVQGFWPIGEGARTQAVAELRAALAEEGLLDEARKQPLPEYPSCIGVVTSPTGSAREDVATTVQERHPGLPIKLCGATVQGEDAVPSLVGAVRTLESDPAVDVIVVTRGGGADTDLWCFNEEPVVRAIADTTTPVLVAIGHEDDQVLAQAVADAREKTPTAAAVATAPDLAAVTASVVRLERRVADAYGALVEDRLTAYERQVETAMAALEQAVATRRAERRQARQRAADLERWLSQAYETLVEDRLGALEHRLDGALRDIEHAAETDAVTARAARGRIGDLEARIDQAYRAGVTRELDVIDARIDRAYRDLEADARIEAGTAQARRLRVAVGVLLAILLLGVLAVALGLL